MRALVVDDHPLIQEAVRNVLRRLEPQAAVDVAGDCERGLDLAGHGAEPDLVLTKLEIKLLDQLVPNRGTPPTGTSLSKYLTKIARLGGYLARANDPPPGNIVMWRGLARLTDIKLGATLAGVVGN